eukprot:scaffold65927_cov61-Phaeocystis_antarctica.AAC.4
MVRKDARAVRRLAPTDWLWVPRRVKPQIILHGGERGMRGDRTGKVGPGSDSGPPPRDLPQPLRSSVARYKYDLSRPFQDEPRFRRAILLPRPSHHEQRLMVAAAQLATLLGST